MARRPRPKPLYIDVAPDLAAFVACCAFHWLPAPSMALLMMYGMHKVGPYQRMLRNLRRDGTVAGCTSDDDRDGCSGRGERHEGDPTSCVEWFGGGNYCGIR